MNESHPKKEQLDVSKTETQLRNVLSIEGRRGVGRNKKRSTKHEKREAQATFVDEEGKKKLKKDYEEKKTKKKMDKTLDE